MTQNGTNNNATYIRPWKSCYYACWDKLQVALDATRQVKHSATWTQCVIFGVGVASWAVSSYASYLEEKDDKDPNRIIYTSIKLISAMVTIGVQNALPQYVAGTLQKEIANKHIDYLVNKNNVFLGYIKTLSSDNQNDSVNFSYTTVGNAVQECAQNAANIGVQLPLYSGILLTSLCKVIISGRYVSILVPMLGSAIISLSQNYTANVETKIRQKEITAVKILEEILKNSTDNLEAQISDIQDAISSIAINSRHTAIGVGASYTIQSLFKELGPYMISFMGRHFYAVDPILTLKVFFDTSHIVYLMTRVLQKYNVNKKEIEKFTSIYNEYNKKIDLKYAEQIKGEHKLSKSHDEVIVCLNNTDRNNDNTYYANNTSKDDLSSMRVENNTRPSDFFVDIDNESTQFVGEEVSIAGNSLNQE